MERHGLEDALAQVEAQDEVAPRVDRHEVGIPVPVHVGDDDLLRRELRVARLRRHVRERAVEVVAEELVGLVAAEEVDVEVAVEVEVEKGGVGVPRRDLINGGSPGVREIHFTKETCDGLFRGRGRTERDRDRRARPRAQPFLHFRRETLDRQPHHLREHLGERLLIARRHPKDVLQDADLDGRALDVATAEERPGLPEKLTRACVAVRDERVELGDTLRQRGRVACLPLEDEKLQSRRQIRRRAGDDLGEARPPGGLFGRRGGRVRLDAPREPPARLEIARVEGRRLLEGGPDGGGTIPFVLEDGADRVEIRPIRQRERLAEERFGTREILPAQSRDGAVRERQRLPRHRVRQLRERRPGLLRPVLLELREPHVAQRQDA